MESAEGVGPEASKKGIGASAKSHAPEELGEPAFDEARSDPGSQSTGVTKSSERMLGQMHETKPAVEELGYPWPPKKEELEHLYLARRLSAMKISRVYGLKYPNPKSGESMILWYLRKFGIQRRDPAEHIRKITEEMVDAWVRRYEAGESLKAIAGESVVPVTVFNHLKRRGIQLRDKVEAQIKAVTKHQRKPFSEKDEERAYLSGFRAGDLNVVRHGRAVRVRTGTTHPWMATLFQELFHRYGYVHMYPKAAPHSGYEWNLESDLDGSFEFLMLELSEVPGEFANEPRLFHSFLAGFFDAEGSLYLHRKAWGSSFEMSITNTNVQLLTSITKILLRLNYYPKLVGQRHRSESPGWVHSRSPIWRIMMWRRSDVARLLREMPLRHNEKRIKRELALRFFEPIDAEAARSILSEWEKLLDEIEIGRNSFVEKARVAMSEQNLH